MTAPTMELTIWCGLKEGYDGPVHTVEEVEQICREYVADVPMCVTVTRTKFIYPGGEEPGVAIGLINYPRFPVYVADQLYDKAYPLAEYLKSRLGQKRVSIVTPHDTVTIGNKE